MQVSSLGQEDPLEKSESVSCSVVSDSLQLMDCRLPGFSMKFPGRVILERVAIPFFREDPWVRKVAGEGNGNPLHYSCLGNPMDRGAWPATVLRVSKEWGT